MESLLSAAPLWFLQVFTNLLQVEEGGAALLTEQHLMVRDHDTRWEWLRVELQATPVHGHLELRGRALQMGEGFSLQDLKELRVRSEFKGHRVTSIYGKQMNVEKCLMAMTISAISTIMADCDRKYSVEDQGVVSALQVRP